MCGVSHAVGFIMDIAAGKLKSNDDFRCTRCFKGCHDPFAEKNVKQGCVVCTHVLLSE